MAPIRDGLTPLRRTLGAALVVLLLVGAVLYYRGATSAPVAASGRTTPSDASPSPVIDPEPSPSTATPAVGGQSESAPARAPTIVVYADQIISASPSQTIRIRGTYHGGADTFVQAERREGATWVAFPLLAKTDRLGRFITHIELGAPGPYWVRVVDPATEVASAKFVVDVKG